MLSVTIITHNEVENLPAALASVAWADEVIVVDSESTDTTVEIARQAGAKVFVRPWPGYAAQKNFADAQASGNWILSIDADERVTPELKSLIEKTIRANPPQVGFYVKRRNFYLGRWLAHSGWYPDYQLRLYRPGGGTWKGNFVHESFQTEGLTARLPADLEHYSIRSLQEHHERLGRYTTLAAAAMQAEGKQTSVARIMIAPVLTFVRSYIFKLGILDGFPGFCVSFFAAYYVFLKYAKRWESQR
ncbi:MAG: glycosyltransferase family 2 protein [Blastocatellia bacterium]|nr:glycosyltransferase family 2 protein [Blastocatellia bacterium]